MNSARPLTASFILIVVMGLALLAWGSLLIYREFVDQLDLLYMLKAPSDTVPEAIRAEHEDQARKTAVVQVGLVVVGSILVTLGCGALIRIIRR